MRSLVLKHKDAAIIKWYTGRVSSWLRQYDMMIIAWVWFESICKWEYLAIWYWLNTSASGLDMSVLRKHMIMSVEAMLKYVAGTHAGAMMSRGNLPIKYANETDDSVFASPISRCFSSVFSPRLSWPRTCLYDRRQNRQRMTCFMMNQITSIIMATMNNESFKPIEDMISILMITLMPSRWHLLFNVKSMATRAVMSRSWPWFPMEWMATLISIST